MLPGILKHRPSQLPYYVPRAGDSCILWLPGQDDPQSSIVRDRSGQGNHGTITGATWVRTGKGLWLLSYDGVDDYTTCPNSVALEELKNKDMTAIVWFKMPAQADVNQRQLIGTYSTLVAAAPVPNQYWALFVNNDTLHAVVRRDNAAETVDAGGATVITDSAWHMGVFRKDGLVISAILDDNAETDTTNLTAEGNTQSDQDLRFARTFGRKLQAYIALPKVFNRVLTATEISYFYRLERHHFGV